MNYKKLLTILLLIISIFFVLWVFFQQPEDSIIPAKENIETIEFSNSKNKLFFRAKAWGISGNHEEITLSATLQKLSNKKNQYIFYTPEVFYKTNGKDSLIIYAPKNLTSVPEEKISDINIIVKNLKTSRDIYNYKKNHVSYGLKMISIYE